MKNKVLFIVIPLILLAIIAITYFKKEVVFTINEERIVLKVNEQKRINYDINIDSVITWTSNNPTVATIDENGVITAKTPGSTTITGSIKNRIVNCLVIVNDNVHLQDIELPNGEILLSVRDTYLIPITYIPSDSYIEKTDYIIEDNNIIKVEDNKIIGLNPGYTTLTIIANDIRKELIVNVTNNSVSNNIITPVKQIDINQEEMIYVNDTKELKYTVEPTNADIFDIKWTTDDNIIEIDDGIVKGIKSGEATVDVLINNKIKKSIKIIVKDKISQIKLDYSPKTILKVGDTLTLEPTIIPSNTSAKIIYESNSNILSVSNNKITALKSGMATITIRDEDNNAKMTYTFTILDNKGLINSNSIVFGYHKDTDTTPVKADINFFLELAKKGKGTVSNNTYIYKNYVYDIQTNLLTIDNKEKIYMRIYYPLDKDLSSLNTFTFIGGIGETNFGGTFEDINKNPSTIKNSGIIIQIPDNNRVKVQGKNVAKATSFVKEIINQNVNARNNIGGYSNGGPPVGDAIENGNYNKVMIIDSSFYWVKTRPKAKDLEYTIYSPRGDSWKGTDTFINELYNFGVKDVKIITNNTNFIERFKDKYLVINPGNSMKNGHTNENLIVSNFFSYGVE